MGVVPKVTRDRENVPAYQVKLERVLGLTVSNNAGLDSDPNSELVAYPAGCTVVLLDLVRGRQTHIMNNSKKTITCVGFSSDGKFLATGECGHCPSLRLWDLQENTMVAELSGHKYSINCLAFSPTQKYVVSVGSQHDMIVNVWDWRAGLKVASNKVSTKVKAISFAENGTYFVTVGNRHVKFWYLEYHRGAKYKEPVPLMGRSAILGEQRNNDFVDVACGRGETADSTYTITRSGLLCEFNNRRLLDKWVELRTASANCMTLGEDRIFIGCADGIVRCFNPHTLQFITTLPRTHYLGVDVAQGLDITHMATHPQKAKYPDAIAVSYDERNSKLTCVYNDHSLYIWDVRDIKRVGKSHSYLYHSACIWGVEMFPEGSLPHVPPGSFVTCSSDDTIRIWNVDSQHKTQAGSAYQRNIYSKELIKVLYIDPELNCLKDMELIGGEKTDNPAAYDGKNGVRSLRISPDGKHLASGDRAGNIRVHDVATLEELCLIEAHDAEVLTLEYNRQVDGKKLLASASRDRLVHVFDVNEDYNFLQTLDDHSSSITAVRFLNTQPNLQMVSCGADKSIIFRQLQPGPDGQMQFNRVYNAAGKTTLYDMEVDVSHKHVITACQDRNIRVYNVSSGKHTKTFKGSIGEEGSLIKVAFDQSGIYVATSCTDKTLCIYDYYSGECMATMSGHSELVTGLRFSQDCSRLISASGDGCVLIWTVPHDMVVTMQARLSQQAARNKKPVKISNGIHLDNDDFAPSPLGVFDPNANSTDYSIGQLPVWAKKEIEGGEIESRGIRVSGPKGKWAHRIDHTGITIKSIYDSEMIPFATGDKKLDSDGSKEDSSVDSGAETGRSLLSNHKRETTIVSKVSRDTSIDFLHCPESIQEILDHNSKPHAIGGKITLMRGTEVGDNHFNKHHTDDSSLGSFKYEDIESTEHDGDVEDYSEGESSDNRRPLYIPQHDEPNREFPITNIDSTELRKSMKKSKRPDLLMVTSEMSSASRSMSGSQSDDDDHATTPTSDHNMHSISTDALDVIAHREKFLKNTFESLSGAEDASSPTTKGKRSLSSQHHGSQSGSTRNSNVIQAAKHTKNDIGAVSKREELQRRIQETRRQLQSVGYRSTLKTSQSIQDLSMHGIYNDSRPKPVPRHRTVQQVQDDSGGIRRACSLSDLANPSPRQRGANTVLVNKPHSPVKNLSCSTRHASTKSSLMMRSSSVGVLNQSDSESDISQATGQRSLVSLRIMRPTISSQNKVASNSTSKSRMEARRRGLSGAYSSITLNQAGNTEDSSSEENQAPTPSSKPTPPPRPKSVNLDRSNGPRRSGLGRSGSERDIARASSKIQRSSSAMIRPSLDPSPYEIPVKDTDRVDVTKAPLSQDLVETMAERLQKATDSVLELHRRLLEQTVDQAQREALLAVIGETQKKLGLVTRNDS
ncbi:mitogen-activated protein kinase-binding protein 1 isoform X3 [Cimex lectularius]|uniref:Mitogen-activated protein kinase-binding protein 1 n=1 Tax=Cimex lectularius TaxID=79782 RepID=A0A8I6SF83_CIMLE|nr:mitogen-activated protein kinase-binding protein 1 isoform X3 [Cimex lectularius]XP_014259760.1 mitogen-activated protein kinase-binding protein 1 isoform X3 [Cimex lectularius]